MRPFLRLEISGGRGRSPGAGYRQQQESAGDADVFPEVNHVRQYRIASHIPVVMANHRRAQGVENKDDRQRAGEKPSTIRIAAGTSIMTAIIAARVGIGAPEAAMYCTVPSKPSSLG